MASSTLSALNPVTRDIVVLSFQLQEFLETNHAYTDLLDESSRQLLKQVVTSNFRPPQISRGISSARDQRARERSQSAEPRSWPASWAVDKSSFRTALNTFDKGTEALRRLQDPPSTGKAPRTSPLSTPSQSTISNPSGSSSSNPPSISALPSNSGLTTRATSAEEGIYNQPIGPELPAMAGQQMTPQELRDFITQTVQSAVQNFQPPAGQQGPPGPPGPPGVTGEANRNDNENNR